MPRAGSLSKEELERRCKALIRKIKAHMQTAHRGNIFYGHWYVGVAHGDVNRLLRYQSHQKDREPRKNPENRLNLPRYNYWQEVPAVVKAVENYFTNHPNIVYRTLGSPGGVSNPTRIYVFKDI